MSSQLKSPTNTVKFGLADYTDFRKLVERMRIELTTRTLQVSVASLETCLPIKYFRASRNATGLPVLGIFLMFFLMFSASWKKTSHCIISKNNSYYTTLPLSALEIGVRTRNRTEDASFAEKCLATWRYGHGQDLNALSFWLTCGACLV